MPVGPPFGIAVRAKHVEMVGQDVEKSVDPGVTDEVDTEVQVEPSYCTASGEVAVILLPTAMQKVVDEQVSDVRRTLGMNDGAVDQPAPLLTYRKVPLIPAEYTGVPIVETST